MSTPFYKLIAIGCGRSGTTYFADLLNNNGIDIHHERLGPDGGVGWRMITDYEHVVNKRGLTENLFHLVRNPINTIPSMNTHVHSLFMELNETVGGICLRGPNPLAIAASAWVQVNKWCAKYTDKVIRIEEVVRDCAAYGVNLDINAPRLPRTDPCRSFRQAHLSLQKNRRRYIQPPLEAFHQLPQWPDILKMGERYGYNLQVS